MKIIRLLYTNYCLSFLICFLSSLIIFFIFSLIGNLNEELLFNTILKLSLLNSLQILIYVPAFIFLMSVILFIIFLRMKNEIIIIKTYLSAQRFLIFFIPVVILFSILELNKSKIILSVDDIKDEILQSNKYTKTKIFLKEDTNLKTYTVLNSFDFNNINNLEYRSYQILNNKINIAEYSNSLSILDNILRVNNYTIYKEDLIENVNRKKMLDISINQLSDTKTFVKKLTTNKNFKVEISLLNLFIFFVLFFLYIFFIFFNSKFVNSKQSLRFPILISILILIYAFIVFNTSLSFYKKEFEIIGSVIVGMFLLKEYLSE